MERSRPAVYIRVLILLVSTAVGIGVVEWALRWTYPKLPSIAALHESDFRLERLVELADEPDLSLCHEVRSFLSHRSRWTGPDAGSGVHFSALQTVDSSGVGTERSFGPRGGTPTRLLWVAGDSLAYGLGVGPNEGFPNALAENLTATTGGEVMLRNLAVPGAGFCTAMQRITATLAAHKPDLVLLVLSADDLEERLMLDVNGSLVAPPDLARGRLTRWLVNRSWFANLLWFRVAAVTERVSSGGKRFVGKSTREGFRAAVARTRERVEAAGGRLVVVVVEPPGMPFCAGSLAQDHCGWLKEDMQTMSALLSEAKVRHTVLQGMWTRQITNIVAQERTMASRGQLAMHPSGVGHARLAEVMWPVLRQAL